MSGEKIMKRIAALPLLALVACLVAMPTPAAAQGQGQGQSQALSIPIVGSGEGATFEGVFNLRNFVSRDGQVFAAGTLVGTVTTALGEVINVVRNVRLPVTVTNTTCEILLLDLGPLHIDLLGLQIDLSRVVLEITAEQGPGNLLGNLLCAVVGLLDNPSGLANLLNQILGLIR
jgi:hypothetical protein